MRRFFAYPVDNQVNLLPDKRVEELELKWIGNAQFEPTLLGFIEGAPPIPSENLTEDDDYNGATSVELTTSEDISYSWNRSQDSGLGADLDVFAGAEVELTAGIGVMANLAVGRGGVKGVFDFSYQFQHESNITASSSLSMTDNLELRGMQEEEAKFPHLGKRFVPKNVGYALVVSSLADVYITRLARTGRMVSYDVRPVEGIPPDVNTITFMINPAYTMNGSLDGLTGSNATSDRFFKHVPDMRAQYGALYPASYYRLQEAYHIKKQIEAEDKRRESFFSNFNALLLDESSLDRETNKGDLPPVIGTGHAEIDDNSDLTEEEQKKKEKEELDQKLDQINANTEEQKTSNEEKEAEIQAKIDDQEQQAHASECFAKWQRNMENLQIRAGKRNIVNTYVWDADGGLRTEAQSFANTVEHTIGGSFTMNAGLGAEVEVGGGGAKFELTALATVNLTQTMNKTEERSKGLELNVDLSGVEHGGVTDFKDYPIQPGEKVKRYRFMSFYLEGGTEHFHDFFNKVVNPEWLMSNSEEARALRQAQSGKPNKTWRVMHRVTYVERPALMGFGRDVRKIQEIAEPNEHDQLINRIAEIEEKLNAILTAVESTKKD